MFGRPSYGNFAHTKRTTKEEIWMNGTEINSHFYSRLPQTVVCVVYPAGWRCLTLSADINSALDRSITRIGSSKCRRNGKVLTSRTLRNPRLQDAATKVGVMVRNDSVKVELLPKCNYVILNSLILWYLHFRGTKTRSCPQDAQPL